MKRIIVHGCYNTQNFGDLLILDLLSRHLIKAWDTRPICPWVHENMKSIVEALPGRGLLRNCLSLDAAILGGGGYLNDEKGEPYAMRRLLRYSIPSQLWQLFKIPYIIAGVGAGPISSSKGASRIAKVCKGAITITVRDEESRDLLTHIGVCPEKIKVTADFIMALSRDKIPTDATAKAKSILNKNIISTKQRYLGLHFPNLARNQNKLLQLCQVVAECLKMYPEIQPFWIFDHGQDMLPLITRLLRLTEPRLPSCPHHFQRVLLGAQILRPAKSG